MVITHLEIGSGKMPHSGYTTLDIEPESRADIIGDFREMSFEGLEAIRADHLLEHFSRQEGIAVLKLWHSWLKQGGTLTVETPDFKRIGYFFLNPQKNWGNPEWMVRHAYGSQEADWAYHRDGWYKEKFEKVLPELGFDITLVKEKYSYARDNGERFRLPNVIAIATKR